MNRANYLRQQAELGWRAEQRAQQANAAAQQLLLEKSCGAVIRLKNTTPHRLLLCSSLLGNGTWSVRPPDEIEPFAMMDFCVAEPTSSQAGVTGHLRFAYADEEGARPMVEVSFVGRAGIAPFAPERSPLDQEIVVASASPPAEASAEQEAAPKAPGVEDTKEEAEDAAIIAEVMAAMTGIPDDTAAQEETNEEPEDAAMEALASMQAGVRLYIEACLAQEESNRLDDLDPSRIHKR